LSWLAFKTYLGRW